MRPLLLALLAFALMVDNGNTQDNQGAPSASSIDKSSQFEKLQKEALPFEPRCMANVPAKQWDGAPTRCLCRPICIRAGLTILSGEDKKWFTSCANFDFCSDVAPPTASTPTGGQLDFLPPELRELFRKDIMG